LGQKALLIDPVFRKVANLAAKVFLELFQKAGFKLADAFARDVVALADFPQGGGLVSEQAVLENIDFLFQF
jgi:hypothetical protein